MLRIGLSRLHRIRSSSNAANQVVSSRLGLRRRFGTEANPNPAATSATSAGQSAGPRRVSQQMSQGQGVAKTDSAGGVSVQSLLFAALFTFIGGVVQQCYANPSGEVATKYREARDAFCKHVLGIDVDEIFLPANSIPIPIWPTDPVYAQVPPGTPAPIMLVLDVEKTLVGTQHDHKYGWRYVKRPGLDKFINALGRNYFEIVLFCETDLDEKVIAAIDPNNICHKLNSSHGELRSGQCLKRLDLMNRDVRKIILIDDNPDAAQLFSENTLIIKPFEDVKDKNDSELMDLVPLLQSLVHYQVDDVRQVFNTLLPYDSGKHSANEAVLEYNKRLGERKEAEVARRYKGLGSLLRGKRDEASSLGGIVKDNHIPSALDLINASEEDLVYIDGADSQKKNETKTKLLETIDNERPDPNGVKLNAFKPATGPVNKKKGKLLSWVEDAEKEKVEQEMRKREKMEEIYRKKMAEKQK